MTLPTEGDASVAQRFWQQNRFACVAFLLAFVALALIILPHYVFRPPRSSLGSVARLLHALNGSPDEGVVAYETRIQHFKIGGVSAAIAAVALALVSLVRRERRALALAALGVAAVAIFWHYVVVGVVAAVILVILLGILS
jgi:hypothetical protein